MRVDGRAPDKLRALRVVPHFMPNSGGSCLMEWGNTRVLITANVEKRVPPFLAGQGKGCSVIVVTTEQPSGIMFISLSAATQNDSISEPGTWDRRTRDAAGPS